ncbi:hypothetical protein J802_4605, partial [Acinetobacter baumannii 45002_9]
MEAIYPPLSRVCDLSTKHKLGDNQKRHNIQGKKHCPL